jgi:hypothetical protein
MYKTGMMRPHARNHAMQERVYPMAALSIYSMNLNYYLIDYVIQSQSCCRFNLFSRKLSKMSLSFIYKHAADHTANVLQNPTNLTACAFRR